MGQKSSTGIEYVVIEEHKHPMVIDSAKLDFWHIHNYRSLDKAVAVLSKFSIKDTDGTWDWQTKAYLTERVDSVKPNGEYSTYFSICYNFWAKQKEV